MDHESETQTKNPCLFSNPCLSVFIFSFVLDIAATLSSIRLFALLGTRSFATTFAPFRGHQLLTDSKPYIYLRFD